MENTDLRSSISKSTDQNMYENRRARLKRRKKTNLHNNVNYYVITGGDGFEDFTNPIENLKSVEQGNNDSTSYLLIWSI